jgi:hypothetical protein
MLDINVLSETRILSMNPDVAGFLAEFDRLSLYIGVLTASEFGAASR